MKNVFVKVSSHELQGLSHFISLSKSHLSNKEGALLGLVFLLKLSTTLSDWRVVPFVFPCSHDSLII